MPRTVLTPLSAEQRHGGTIKLNLNFKTFFLPIVIDCRAKRRAVIAIRKGVKLIFIWTRLYCKRVFLYL
ncbi:MAG: hypothetical protein ACLS7Z_02170 [Christensenellales bacterium]